MPKDNPHLSAWQSQKQVTVQLVNLERGDWDFKVETWSTRWLSRVRRVVPPSNCFLTGFCLQCHKQSKPLGGSRDLRGEVHLAAGAHCGTTCRHAEHLCLVEPGTRTAGRERGSAPTPREPMPHRGPHQPHCQCFWDHSPDYLSWGLLRQGKQSSPTTPLQTHTWSHHRVEPHHMDSA